jgi:glucokinase
MSKTCLLVGDIGGTNARFAIADESIPGFSRQITLRCADFESADVAIEHYLKKVKAARPTVICLAAAGPIVDGSVRFTNNSWTIGADDIGATFDAESVRLLNDFEAIAYSVPFLGDADCVGVGLPPAKHLGETDFAVGILGPGTGLGAVGLLKRGEQLIPIVGEAGHVGFSPETQVQMDILAALRERFDRVSNERLVSGPGIENIYWALSRLHGEKRPQLEAAQIFEQGMNDSSPLAVEAVQMFYEILGQVAGNLALTLGAADGIFIAGGIARRYPKLLASSHFRGAFESKGRHRSLLEKIPTQLIVHPHPGLLGASYCALELARKSR